MAPREQDENDDGAIRVTDRRRITETGDERDESSRTTPSDGGAEDVAETGAPAAGGAAPGTSEDAGAEVPGSAGFSVDALGIEAVFFVFWQSAVLRLGAADPSTGEALPVDLDEARQSIELLKILEKKTRGNLTDDEQAAVQRLLHDAQMRYVEVARSGTDVPPETDA